jgi:hypothetical protein
VEFIDVAWLHNDQSDPVRLVSELDAERYETRKLEFFPNGRVGFASSTHSSAGTELGIAPVPALSEINLDPQFQGSIITASEFEALWSKHAKST